MTNSSFQMDCYCGILPNPSVLMFTLDAATCFISTCSYSYTHTQTHNLICFFKRFLITPHYLWNQIESLLPCNLKDKTRIEKWFFFSLSYFLLSLQFLKSTPVGKKYWHSQRNIWEILIQSLPPPPHLFHGCEKCGSNKRRNLFKSLRWGLPWRSSG